MDNGLPKKILELLDIGLNHHKLGEFNKAMEAYDKYFKLAKEFNLTMVQLAQSFVNSRPFVTSNIIGATTMDQLKENVESIDIEFTDEMMDRVNEIHNNNPNPSP